MVIDVVFVALHTVAIEITRRTDHETIAIIHRKRIIGDCEIGILHLTNSTI